MRLVRQLLRRSRPHALKVRTTTLDSYFEDERIDFCKIDTQGAEYHVLLGAQQMLREHRIGALYVEFEDNADARIIEILKEADYRIFATIFVVLQGRSALPLEKLGLTQLEEVHLSNGYSAVGARLAPGRNASECFESLQQLGARFHTDLIAVSPARIEEFKQALAALASSHESATA